LFSEDQTTNVPVAGDNRGDWRFRSGTNFGVTKQGNLYANNGTFKGAITAASGSIGGWTIGSEDTVYYGYGSLFYDNGWKY